MRDIKVGDYVKSLVTEFDVTAGSIYRVMSVYDRGVGVLDDNGESYYLHSHEVELTDNTEEPLSCPPLAQEAKDLGIIIRVSAGGITIEYDGTKQGS